ncbi:MAG: hypothetical protein OXN90_06835, partial [Gemmatimonadota bacterium]|nr:hypothetical protein [Gemmatimonadota bacterium]
AIPPSEARGKLQEDEFRFWYPRLLEELELVAKPTAIVIPVGRATWNLLQKQSGFPYRLAGPVLHWGKQTVGAALMASTLFPEEWQVYRQTPIVKELSKSIEETFAQAGLIQHTHEVTQRITKQFREIDKHYIFTYKKQMPLLRPR